MNLIRASDKTIILEAESEDEERYIQHLVLLAQHGGHTIISPTRTPPLEITFNSSPNLRVFG